jgi:hypothetical protein
MEVKMDRFVRKESVECYRRLIESVSEDGRLTDVARRQTISDLLAEEQQKQNDAGDQI